MVESKLIVLSLTKPEINSLQSALNTSQLFINYIKDHYPELFIEIEKTITQNDISQLLQNNIILINTFL